MAAIAVWRLYPTLIESGLSLYAHRSIREWHRGEMSSIELLGLLEEFPETSKFKEATERTRRLVEYEGNLVEFVALMKTPDGVVYPVEIPEDATLIAEYIDWPYDRKLQARNALETASLRMELRKPGQGYDIDLTGLLDPQQEAVARFHQRKRDENIRGARSLIRKGLFKNKRR